MKQRKQWEQLNSSQSILRDVTETPHAVGICYRNYSCGHLSRLIRTFSLFILIFIKKNKMSDIPQNTNAFLDNRKKGTYIDVLSS